MITLGYDRDALILVCVVALPPTPDGDYERVVAALERLAGDAKRRDALAVNVVVVDREHDRPNAAWRQKIAAAEKKCTRLRMALVTESAAARGVITALQWLTGSRDTLKRSTHATLGVAISAMERELGRKLPEIQRLHDAARADMVSSARIA